MPTRSRTSIDGRLAELEKQRDQVMDQLIDRYIAIEREIYTPEELEAIRAAGDDWPPGFIARWRADLRMQALDRIYGRFINWRDVVERLTNQKAHP